jgi:ectoine hydroxylase
MTAPAFTREWSLMTAEQRDRFERDGYLVLPDVLTAAEVSFYTEVVDRTYDRAASAGGLRDDRSLHLLSAVTASPELAGLIDHPRTFPLVWAMLGWNIHIYHSHIDVHPQLRKRRPFWWHWHQDGGRQNRELETDPRPRMSVKVAYWLSDVSVPGRGNLTLVPGSHTANWLPGPQRRDHRWPAPDGAIEVTAKPGDAVFFDRRIWHARSDNHSPVTRKAVFFGYTYRWVSVRDDVAGLPGEGWWRWLTPVQQQLLGDGDGSGDDRWGHYPENTPLYLELRERGLLDPDCPPLIP